MTHLGLFEGIGGFSLAARWMGWETLAWCEWNEFGQKVLRHHFPKAEGFGDITKTDFTKYAKRIDVLTGGFPCQPYSVAGKRKGTDDDRHLWPEMLRAIREIQPRYVVGENVRGLTNWDGGVVFDQVQADLENEGYEVLPFLLPACAVNAPHRRDRIWFVAYSKSCGRGRAKELENNKGQSGEWRGRYTHNISEVSGENGEADAPDTESGGLEGFGEFGNAQQIEGGIGAVCVSEGDSAHIIINAQRNGVQQDETGALHNGNGDDTEQAFIGRDFASWLGATNNPLDWSDWPTQPPLCSRDDGIPSQLVGITVSKHRNESLKAYGNAIVPQVAFQIFKAIKQSEQ